MNPKPPMYRWRITINLQASARLPEQRVGFSVNARSNYRAMVWGLQKLNGGQRKRVRSASIDGPFEQVG